MCISPDKDNGSMLNHIAEAIRECPSLQTIVLGDFNIVFSQLASSSCDANITAALADLKLDIMSKHFYHNHHHCDGFTWKQHCSGKLVVSRCGNILANCYCNFQNVQIRIPSGLLSNHKATCAWIKAGLAKLHKEHLRARKSIPWIPPNVPMDVDEMLEFLHKSAMRSTKEPRQCAPYISNDTWIPLDQWAELCKSHAIAEELNVIDNQIDRSLKKDWKA